MNDGGYLTVGIVLASWVLNADAQQPAPAIAPAPQERLSAQNKLFVQQYQDDLKVSPEAKTAVGDYSDNARLDDYSLAASTRQNATDRAYLAKIRAISNEGFSEEDRISHDLFIQLLEERIADYELKQYEMPVSQMGGVQNSLADLPNAVPLDSVQHYEDYIARLRQIPRVFQQTIAVLRQGEKDGLMQPTRSASPPRSITLSTRRSYPPFDTLPISSARTTRLTVGPR